MPAAPDSSLYNAAVYFIDRHVAESRGDRIAIECGGQRITYAQLHTDVNRFGNALRKKLGVRMEERVLLLLPDVPEFACCFFGAIKIGAVPVPVNTLLRATDYEFLLNDTRARVAVVHDSLAHLVPQIPAERLPFLQALILVGKSPEIAPHPGLEILTFTELLTALSSELLPAPTCRDDSAFWLYSSGSTGPPKACIHLQHDMQVATGQYATPILRITETDRFYSAAKLFFAYGLGNALYFPFAVGATAILNPAPPSPHNVFAAIERHRPTLFFSSPANIAALLDHAPTGETSFASLRLAVSAGESLPATLCQRFRQRFGVEILDGIGSTEATHIFISNRQGEVRPGSAGRIVPGCEAKILDDEGRPLPAGEIGNLWLNSDAVCAGYWNSHDRSRRTIHGEWIATGDKFSQDKDGYFWFAGRSDDMLKVSGVWVSPAEIENVLLQHESVADVAVVAHTDKDGLAKPVAWVVLKPVVAATSELSATLLDFIIARLPAYKRPRKILFVASLPRTATGKIRRFALRQLPVDL